MSPAAPIPVRATLTRRDFFMLGVVTIFWGVNWSVLKFGVRSLPPVWFRFLGLAAGTLVMLAFARWRNIPLTVPRGAWPRLVGLAIPNMITWFLLGIFAIALLPSGRAAILGYTMPIWAALIGVLWFGERLDRRIWLGVAAALVATLLLLAGEWQALSGRPLGAVLMLLAAFGWAVGNHMLRRLPVAMPTVALTFWMMVIASAALLAVSACLEGAHWALPDRDEWLAIGYNAVFVLGICNVAWFSLARSLPPVASGLSGMLIPVVGVFSGMVLLGETPHWRDWVALGLILVALASVVIPGPPRRAR